MPKLNLTRKDLSKFLPDHRSIIAFENLLTINPEEIIDINVDAQNAITMAIQAIGELQTLKDQLYSVINKIYNDTIPNSLPLDAVEFNQNPVLGSRTGVLGLDNTKNILSLIQNSTITQKIGLDEYIFAINNTGGALLKGQCVYFSGVTGGSVIDIDKFIANGSIRSDLALGILAEDLDDGESGKIQVAGDLLDVDTSSFTEGDILYASPSSAGGLTNDRPTTENFSVPMGMVLTSHASTGAMKVNPIIEQPIYFGDFALYSDATLSAIDTATAITYTHSLYNRGISIDGSNPTRLVVSQKGFYRIELRAHAYADNAGPTRKNVWIWYRKNGSDLTRIANKLTLDTPNQSLMLNNSINLSMDVDDYIEVYWAADDTDAIIKNLAATAFAPSVAASRISIIMIDQ